MPNVETHIRGYWKYLDSVYPDVEVEEILSERTDTKPIRPFSPRERKRRLPRWAVATAAAVLVLLMVGAVGLLIRQWSSDTVIEEPPPTTVIDGVGGGWSLVPVEGETLAGATIRSVIRTGNGLVAAGLQDTNLVIPGATGATSTTAPAAAGGLRPGVWLSEDGVAWTRVPPSAFTGEGVGGINDVAEGESGLVAVGQVGCAATVWVSEDELSLWFQVPYDESVFAGSLGTGAGGACSWFDRVVAGPSGFVALGGGFGSGESISISPRLWTSPDGLSWTPLTQEEAGFGDRFLQISHLVSGGAGWVAFGGSCTETPQEVLELFESEESVPNCPVAIWTSSDGAIWEEVPHDEDVFGDTTTRIRSVTQSPNGFIAAGTTVDGVTIWSSVDGRVWQRTPLSGSAFGGDLPDFLVGDALGLVAVSVFDQRCVPIASEEQAALATPWACELQNGSSGIHQSEAQVWTSLDGAIWTPSPSDVKVPGFAFADAAVKFQSGLIVAATDSQPTSHQVLLRWTLGI